MPTRRSIAAVAAALALTGLGGCSVGDEEGRPPQLGTPSDDENAAAKLGFPSSATKNTVRVGGGDAASDVAGVASAVFPGTSDATRPTAVVLVDDEDWQAAVTASVLTANPIGAPILLSDGDELSPVTSDTLSSLDPKGSDLSDDAQVIRIGDAPARPDGYETAIIKGADPYERAAAIDRFISAAKGRPSPNVIVASGEQAAYAMPAAAWSAFSGDSVLLTQKDRLPKPTADAIREHEKPNIFVLGPAGVISEGVEKELRKLGRVQRIEGEDPVRNAVAFTRYERGDFGWGLTTPGISFTFASTDRPLDAAAASTLTARGVPSPLLLTDDAAKLPQPLQLYLLNVQPGYEDDPRDVAYSRAWVLGDDKVISVAQQVEIDRLVDLVPIELNAP